MNDNVNIYFKGVYKEKDKTLLERFQLRLKESIFGLFYVLLKHQEKKTFIEVVTILFELLQLLSYSIHRNVKIFFNHSLVFKFMEKRKFFSYFKRYIFLL